MHQQMISTITNSYEDNIAHGKLHTLREELLSNPAFEHFQFDVCQSDDLFEIKWLKLNDKVYRKELFIFMKRLICRIENILMHKGEYVFLVSVFKTIDFNSFLNSAKIQAIMPKKYELVKLNEMENKNVYEMKILDGELFIIIDTLETKNCFFG